MIESMPKLKMAPLVSDGFMNFVESLNSQNLRIRICISSLLNRIAQNYTENFLDEAKAQKTFQAIHEHFTKDNKKVVLNICMIFDSLADRAPKLNSPNSFFMQHISSFIDILLQCAYNPDLTFEELNIIDKSLSALVSMVQKCLPSSELHLAIEKFFQCLANSMNMTKDRRILTQEGLLIAISSCLWRIGRHNDSFAMAQENNQNIGMTFIHLNKDLASKLYTSIIEMFNLYKTIVPDGLYLLSALATVLRQDFIPKLDELHKYTDHAIKETNEPELLKAGFDTVGHLCRVFPSDYSNLLETTMPYLLQCLKDQNFSKDNKPTIFLTLGDVALGSPHLIVQNMKDILSLYEIAYEAIIVLSDSNVPDNLEYAEVLKENIIDSIVCIVHGALYNDESGMNMEKLNLIKIHFPKLQEFIQKATSRKYNPTIDFVKDCLALLTDIYAPPLREGGVYLNKELITDMIKTLQPHMSQVGVQQSVQYANFNLLGDPNQQQNQQNLSCN